MYFADLPQRCAPRASNPCHFFPDHRGLEPRVLEHFWEGRLGAVEAAGIVVQEAVHVGVLAGQDRGARRAADGVSAVGATEQHALLGDAVDVRGGRDLVVAIAVGGDSFGCMVVGENE